MKQVDQIPYNRLNSTIEITGGTVVYLPLSIPLVSRVNEVFKLTDDSPVATATQAQRIALANAALVRLCVSGFTMDPTGKGDSVVYLVPESQRVTPAMSDADVHRVAMDSWTELCESFLTDHEVQRIINAATESSVRGIQAAKNG